MSFPLFDLVKDLALARGPAQTETDPDKIDAAEASTMRRRLALIAWFPGLGLVLLLGGAMNSALVGLVGIIALVLLLGLFAERGDRFGAWLRRGRTGV